MSVDEPRERMERDYLQESKSEVAQKLAIDIVSSKNATSKLAGIRLSSNLSEVSKFVCG